LLNTYARPLPTALLICPGTVTDVDLVAEVLTRAFHPPEGLEQFLSPWRRFSIAEDLRQRLRDRHPHYCCLVAWVGSQAVGTLEISLRRLSQLPGRARHQKHPYISNLAVHPTWRRRGIARQLLIGAEGVVQTWGHSILHLHVLDTNRPARFLYRTLHYRELYTTSDPWTWLGFPKQMLLYKQM